MKLSSVPTRQTEDGVRQPSLVDSVGAHDLHLRAARLGYCDLARHGWKETVGRRRSSNCKPVHITSSNDTEKRKVIAQYGYAVHTSLYILTTI